LSIPRRAPNSRTLGGRRILLTGASGRIGGEVARTLAARGARLVLVSRHSDALAELASVLEGGPHERLAFDVADEEAWLANASRIAPEGLLDGVVASAARLAPVGPIGTWEVKDFRSTLEVNLIGSLLAILCNLQALCAAKGAVVTFSGGGATGPFPRYDAYAVSKVALVRLTENLAIELAESGIRLNSVAPGFVVSKMHEETMVAGPTLVGDEYYQRTLEALESNAGDSPEFAAQLVAFLLSDEAEGISGKLLSARWDPWQDESFQARLRDEPDLATLRRIDDQQFGEVSQRTVRGNSQRRPPAE
jgi:NAD(P)-dependent dehydrogenase (short-subunit alcohol dehydrogenase family)